MVEMVLNQHSIAERRQRNVLYAQLVNVVVVAVAIYPLARAFRVYGVVMSGVIGEVGNVLVYMFLLRHSHPKAIGFAFRSTFLSMACVVPIAYVGYHFHEEPYSWVVSFPAAALYLLGMLLVGLLLPSDIRRLFESIRHRRRAVGG